MVKYASTSHLPTFLVDRGKLSKSSRKKGIKGIVFSNYIFRYAL